MSAAIGEVFIDYALLKDLEKAYEAGVFTEKGDESENEERHVSELARRMSALDEKETYIAVQSLVKHHKQTVIDTIKYLNSRKEKEGEISNE